MSTPFATPTDTRIVRAAIHPAIGIARVGNSTQGDGYYIGPQVTTPPLMKPEDIRDATGAIKRQGALFRLYGYNAQGEVVRELTAGEQGMSFEWTVHVANRKAEWYAFDCAMDIPEAATLAVPLRNPAVPAGKRSSLVIDSGPKSISGTSTQGAGYQLDGAFQGTPVNLGELRTDAKGRLLFLGGHGKAASPSGAPIYDEKNQYGFNNADGWYDDTSDGSVAATLQIDGASIPVDPAWVVTAPPDFAPNAVGWRTLYDLLEAVSTQAGWIPFPSEIRFSRDVLPLLQRMTGLQWVNQGFAAMFGASGPLNFDDPNLIARLATPRAQDGSDPWHELRNTVFNAFRPTQGQSATPSTWPWIYGDAYGTDTKTAPNVYLQLPDVQGAILKKWVDGDFVGDEGAQTEPPRRIEDVPVAQQPAMLDKAALHFCLADAFHPGCEMTWPMRHATLYMAPFRIRHRTQGDLGPEMGSTMSQQTALAPNGPLYGQRPGDISRWMALPWQEDTTYCRSGYDPQYDPYLPTFWPARVPNQVLMPEAYAKVMDESRPWAERIAAFQERTNWLSRFTSPSVGVNSQLMVDTFSEQGIVLAMPGVDHPDLPKVMFVANFPKVPVGPSPQKALLVKAAAGPRPRLDTRLARAGWSSDEQLEAARSARFGHKP
ncbi:LodA/GoxA family CTQ-dependent oxidase [Hyalangium minutum]|uniref:Lysine-epsilon oxidase n=1 Tax=Hyalangium minutum TaxID=394096 RepID=A0A085WXD7_9BACT|nr:LodA/GoxA family CTQ-dependent oxidase [Hyalangium minutum]KFE72350.1 Lysine-epsilon oxidase [Hyalangium minutum]